MGMLIKNKFALAFDRVQLAFWALCLFGMLFPVLPYEWLLRYLPNEPTVFYSLIAAGQVIALSFLVRYTNLRVTQKWGLFTIGMLSGLVVIVYLFYISYAGWLEAQFVFTIYASICSALATLGIVILRNWLMKTQLPIPLIVPDQDKLKAWLNAGDIYPLDLLSGREDQANRIADILNTGVCHRGLVVYGGYGEGKTTLINSIKPLLPQRYWNIVHFSAWGKAQLVNLVLKDMLNELSKRFETHLVKKLPTDMVKALGQALPSHWAIGRALDALQPSYTQIELIQKLNDLLDRHQQHCLVIIEDVDRGSGGEGNLNTLSALFDVLSQFDRIQFIFTLEDKPAHDVPLTKILDYREQLEPLSSINVVIEFINLCRAEAQKKGIILTDFSFNQSELRFTGSSTPNTLGVYGKSIYADIANVLENPRVLNQVLKSAWQLWWRVMGEVNILDVLVYAAISNSSDGVQARDVIKNWASIRRAAKQDRKVDEILIEKLGAGNQLIKLVRFLLEGTSSDINLYQSIRLNRDTYGPQYLDQLVRQQSSGRVPVSQARLQRLKSIWSDDSKLTPEIIQEMIDDCEEYGECYLAYKATQDLEPTFKNHGKVLSGLFQYIANANPGLEETSQYEYRRRVEPLIVYLGWFLFADRTEPINWLEQLLNLVNDRERARWLLASVYDELLKESNYQLTEGVRGNLRESLVSLLSKVDFQYFLRLPNQGKWRILADYNSNWSASNDLNGLLQCAPEEFGAASIRMLQPFLIMESVDSGWESKTANTYNLSSSDMVVWVAKLKVLSNKAFLSYADAPKLIREAIDGVIRQETGFAAVNGEKVLDNLRGLLEVATAKTQEKG